MANAVGLVTLSHSPSWDLAPKIEGPGAGFVEAVNEARKRLSEHSPDVLVVFGPDHFRNFFYDVLPQFCIGIEKVESFGDYSTPAGSIPCARELGKHVLGYVMNHGFDPAVSLNMSLDHGHVQPYLAMDPTIKTPIVPIMVNVNGGPRPSLRRCLEFGRAVGDAIRTFPGDKRVVFVGSGGMSHWLPSISADDPSIAKDTRDYIINGRSRARIYNAERERSSIERRRSGGRGRINETWDRWFLEAMQTRRLDSILSLTDEVLEANAGNGAHELRSWLAAAAAWGGPITFCAYDPVPTWVTGMGVMAGFGRVPNDHTIPERADALHTTA
jgi:2,3-dihydroxyphenylpropionate 1,2-dioxygenase